MAAYRRVYDSRLLQAYCKEPESAPEIPYKCTCGQALSLPSIASFILLFRDLHKFIFGEVQVGNIVVVVDGNSSIVVQSFHYLLS